jgi:hypothetical protein
MNDGSELQELLHSNIFDIASLQAKLKIAKAQNQSDGYTQANEAFALLREARDLLEVVFDTQLHEQIQSLVKRIDEFYPQAKEK